VRERRLEGDHELVVGRHRLLLARLSGRVEREQLAGQLVHRMPRAGLQRHPGLAAEP